MSLNTFSGLIALLCLWDICWIWAQHTSGWVSVLLLAVCRNKFGSLIARRRYIWRVLGDNSQITKEMLFSQILGRAVSGQPQGAWQQELGGLWVRWLCSNHHLSLSRFPMIGRGNLAHFGIRASLGIGSNRQEASAGSLPVAIAPGGVVVNQAVPIYVFYNFSQHWMWKARRFME